MVSKAFQDLLHSLLFLHPQSFHHRRQWGWWSMMSLVFLCLLLLITFLSFMCLELDSRRMYSMAFPDTEVELTSSSPDCPLAIVKFNLILIFFQLSETFLSHQDFSSRIDSNLVIMSAPSTPSGASHQLLPNISLPCCWLPLPLQFIPVQRTQEGSAFEGWGNKCLEYFSISHAMKSGNLNNCLYGVVLPLSTHINYYVVLSPCKLGDESHHRYGLLALDTA